MIVILYLTLNIYEYEETQSGRYSQAPRHVSYCVVRQSACAQTTDKAIILPSGMPAALYLPS